MPTKTKSTEVAPVKSVKAVSTELVYTNEQIDLIKSQIAVGATDDELALFMQVARSSKLDPFRREIYMIKRNVWDKDTKSYVEKATIQTGIDGYRKIAQTTQSHAGTDDAVLTFDHNGFPEKATVTVYKLVGSIRAPFTATAWFSEYAQVDKNGNLSGQWKKMPRLMIAKCAEALALRKAFPSDLSGIYTDAEMDQAFEVEIEASTESSPEPRTATLPPQTTIEPTIEQKRRITELVSKLTGAERPDLPLIQSTVENYTQLDLVPQNFEDIINRLQSSYDNNSISEDTTPNVQQ